MILFQMSYLKLSRIKSHEAIFTHLTGYLSDEKNGCDKKCRNHNKYFLPFSREV